MLIVQSCMIYSQTIKSTKTTGHGVQLSLPIDMDLPTQKSPELALFETTILKLKKKFPTIAREKLNLINILYFLLLHDASEAQPLFNQKNIEKEITTLAVLYKMKEFDMAEGYLRILRHKIYPQHHAFLEEVIPDLQNLAKLEPLESTIFSNNPDLNSQIIAVIDQNLNPRPQMSAVAPPSNELKQIMRRLNSVAFIIQKRPRNLDVAEATCAKKLKLFSQ